MNTTTDRPAIRSVLLECRSYVDSYGNAYTSARVWVNGGYIGQFPSQYGPAENFEYYTLTPWLENVGILPGDYEPPGAYRPHVRYRLREIGADYYETTAYGLKREQYAGTILPTESEFWEELARRESRAVTV